MLVAKPSVLLCLLKTPCVHPLAHDCPSQCSHINATATSNYPCPLFCLTQFKSTLCVSNYLASIEKNIMTSCILEYIVFYFWSDNIWSVMWLLSVSISASIQRLIILTATILRVSNIIAIFTITSLINHSIINKSWI